MAVDTGSQTPQTGNTVVSSFLGRLDRRIKQSQNVIESSGSVAFKVDVHVFVSQEVS